MPDLYPMVRNPDTSLDRIDDYIVKHNSATFVKTSRCSDKGKIKRLFSDALTSVEDFDDSDWTSMLEKVSPIVIEYPDKNTIFRDNKFFNNTGLFGGSVSIDTPNL